MQLVQTGDFFAKRTSSGQFKVVRLPLPQDQFNREQQDVLIRELESIINQLNFSFQDDLRDQITLRSWFGI